MFARCLPTLLLVLAACNTAPTAGEVTIDPRFPDTRSELRARVSEDAIDPDGDPVDYLYEWRGDGELVADVTTDTVPPDLTERGQVWSVGVVASDGKVFGPEFSAEVTIGNAPPTVGLSITPEQPRGDDDLQAQVVYQDADDDIVEVEWSWSVNGVERTELTDRRVPASETRRGEVWEVTARPSDEFGSGPSSTASVTIYNAPPVVVLPAITPEFAHTDTTLTASASATDEEGDPVGITVHWVRDGVDLGQTGPTLDPSFTAKGDRISARFVANDGFDDSEPVTAGPVAILNSPPTPPTLRIEPGTEEDDIWCEVAAPSFDADGDAISYTFSWTVDGAAWTGSTGTTAFIGDTIIAEDTAQGQEWVCTVTASDGDTASEPATAEVRVGGGNVSFRAGYYFVKADHAAYASEHATVCSSVGLSATASRVTLTWNSALLSDLARDFGHTSVGDVNNSAQCMWCYETGSSYPTGNFEGSCETHNFGSYYDNYGRWGSYANQRPVFTCTR